VKCVAAGSGITDPKHEIEALARTQAAPHENVVRFFGHADIAAGSLLVFECINGGELFDHVIDMLSSGSPVPVERAHFLFRQIARGVAHLHRLGIAHLDVKLENCMISSDMQTVSVVDLGLWHDLHLGPVSHFPYRGSPAYMAPEIFANRTCGASDVARFRYEGVPADVWSLGICLFVMIMGFYPLEERPTEVLYQHLAHKQALGIGTLEATCGPAAVSHYPHRVGYAPSRARKLNTLAPAASALLDGMLVVEPSGRASVEQVLSSEFIGDVLPCEEGSSAPSSRMPSTPPPAPPSALPPAAPVGDELPPRKRAVVAPSSTAWNGGADAARGSGGCSYRDLDACEGTSLAARGITQAYDVDTEGASRGIDPDTESFSSAPSAIRSMSTGPPVFHGQSSFMHNYHDAEPPHDGGMGGVFAVGKGLAADAYHNADEDDEGLVAPSYRSAGGEAEETAPPPPLTRQQAVTVCTPYECV